MQYRNRCSKFLLILLTAFLIVAAGGCVQVPAEAPVLSAELGKRISALQDSHLQAVRMFIDQKRKMVDQFMDKEWVPMFAGNLMQDPKIKERWNLVNQSGTDDDKIKFLTLIGPAIQERVNQQRAEFIAPLDQLEITIERQLRDEYSQALAINNSITSLLDSAAKVAANRDRYLEELGVKKKTFSDALDKADHAVDQLLQVRAQGQEAATKIQNFKNDMATIIESVKKL